MRSAEPVDSTLGYVMDNDEVERALRTGEEAGVLEDFFGPADYAELRRLSQQASAKRAVAGPRVLILPGITGSKLGRRLAGNRENVVWFDPLELANGGVAKIALDSGIDIVPAGVILLYYLKLKLRLRAAGFDADFHAYDWRRSLDALGAELADRIRSDAALDRVSLVCHSMGGLVARAAVAALGAAGKRVMRVIQLGTPNYGAFAAVQTLRAQGGTVKKLAFLDLRHDADQIVTKVLAPMPGCCQLLPSPERYNAIDLFDVAAWPAAGPKPDAAVLRQVPAVLKKLAPADERFFLIAGVNKPTFTGLRFEQAQNEFVFEETLAGDGTVPLALAELPGVKATYYIEENHGSLANNRTVARAVADLLGTGSTSVLPTTPPALRREAVREVTESQLAAQQPYPGRRTPQLSQRELRNVLADFASVETADGEELLPVAAGALPAAAFAQRLDRVVIGRRRQHRIDIRLALGDVADVNAHALVVGIYRAVAPSGAAKALDARLDGAITELTQRRMFSGNVGEIFLLPTAQRSVRPDMIAFAGLGAFDTFNDEVLRIAAENAIRTLVLGGVSDVATVLIGAGSGTGTQPALESLLAGFVKGLMDSDKGHRFRCLTVCEADPERYDGIKQELFRLSTTRLFENLEVTFFEERLPPSGITVAGERAAPVRGPDPVYLLVRNEAGKSGLTQFHTSVLGAGGKAAVVSGTRSVQRSELDAKLALLRKDSFGFQDGEQLGQELARMVLSEEALAILAAMPERHLVVVHDAESSRIPWELLAVPKGNAGWLRFAKEGGMSRRYVADNMSVAKWLEERREDPELNILLVVNPTGDLDGAEKEGERLRELFGTRPGMQIDELREADATRPALEQAFRSGKYDAVHYAGHAFFDPRDPAGSGLVCAGGSVLSGRDLSGLGNLPALVFFNACEAGRVRKRGAPPVPRTVREQIERNVGLAEAFLRGGVANYIGTYWPVGDTPAELFAERFYTALLRGETAGAALLAGRRAVRDKRYVDWADYIHYGSHDFALKVR